MHVGGYKSLASLLGCPSAFDSIRQGLLSELISFAHREAAHARLGLPKVPQLCVDLVNMAAPPLCRACTIGKAALFYLLLFLFGIVEVAFQSRKHGIRGTCPRRCQHREWDEIATWDGYY
jgi:hypothetical protein